MMSRGVVSSFRCRSFAGAAERFIFRHSSLVSSTVSLKQWYSPIARIRVSCELLSMAAAKTTLTAATGSKETTQQQQQQQQHKPSSRETMLQQLQDFVQRHGHARVPEKWSPNPTLARWIAYNRTKYRSGLLDAKEIQQLEDLGMVWDPYEYDWKERYAQLVAFHQRHGHCLVSPKSDEHQALGRWVVGQRYQYRLMQEGKTSHMTPERVQLLNKIEFQWEPQEAIWNNHYKQLRRFRREHGHCLVPREYDAELYRWVEMNRYQYKKFVQKKYPCSMTPERIELLEKVEFVWSARDAAWLERFQELEEFIHANGPGLMPPVKTHASLRSWLNRQLKLYEERLEGKSVSLTKDRTEALKRLGFLL